MLLLKTENLISIRGRERQEEQRPGGCLYLLNMNQSSWRQEREGTLIWNHVPSPDRCCLMAVVLRTLMTAASLLGCLATVVGGVVVPLSCKLNSTRIFTIFGEGPYCKVNHQRLVSLAKILKGTCQILNNSSWTHHHHV